MTERDRVVGLVLELEKADEEAAAALAELDELARETISLRARALELQEFQTKLPLERHRLAAEVERATSEVETATAAVAEAEDAVRRATKDGEADAHRFEVRARDRLSVATRRLREVEAEAAALETSAEEAERGAREVEDGAHILARSLRGRPRLAEAAGSDPGRGLEAVAQWAESARAALFVARGQLAAEREAVIRQANELGAVTLGEPLSASSASVVARRLEHELT